MTGSLRNIALFILLICFIPILFLGIFDLDEGAFAATSLQMLIDKQYFIPTIGDDLRLEKPILSYWIQAISISIFGANEFALRLPSFLASLVWAHTKDARKDGSRKANSFAPKILMDIA